MESIAHPLVSIISEKLIKPSSPTCPTKRWHKLSLIDQAFSNSYIPFSLFYTKDAISKNNTQISQLLEESLSKILSIYYPYAGRLKDNTTVDCNDAGAEFVQVRIDCLISETFNWHNTAIEDLLFPQGLPWSNCTTGGLVVVNTVAAESEVQNPTRTEVVSALIFKCAVRAAKAKSGIFQPSSMVQAVDLRAQVGLPPNAIGNLLTICPTSITNNEESMTISKLVSEMRKSKELVYKRDNINDNMFVALLLELAKSKQEYHDNGPNAYQITSLVKFALHEIDFGWGKPTKVSIANGLNNKLAILMGNQSGGLDAFVTLTEHDMSVFERDTELLEFASIVPSC
ncbi:hypothetical protein MTR67_023081 [Solanum verrucosum]|uniref:Acyltransferase n=1 Tax=Solanum verrucosum TaxID=315347 RepID=A0AAF0R086_SOLVR|nr:hypothetical protein MTR67_023081 [Solanum verrucosum]